MTDLRDLYQTTILDHGRSPRNFGPLPEANRTAAGHNPLCGDRLVLHLEVEGDVVAAARFEGSGCAISTASASMLTEAVTGKSVADAEALFQKFHSWVAGRGPADLLSDQAASLGKLAVFGGVREFPVRVKCATLAWHAMHSALSGDGETVKTE